MSSRQSYRKPIVISVILHCALFALLFLHFSPHKTNEPDKVKIIQAVAINENQLQSHPRTEPNFANNESLVPKVNALPQNMIRKIEQTALKQPEVTNASVSSPQQPPTLPVSKSLPKKQEAPEMLQEPQYDQAQVNKAAEKQRKQELKKKLELAKKRKEEESKLLQKQLAQEAKEIEREADAKSSENSQAQTNQQERDLDDQIESEKKQLSASQSHLAQAGEINKYKQMIIEAISRKWLIPDSDNQELSCQLLVHVGPGGIVLNVDVLKESGDDKLDRSARQAIMKASPLPVPENEELFDNFRSLRLTFRPQGIVSG